MENLQIKTSAAESDTIIELRNDLELRRDLRRWYQYVRMSTAIAHSALNLSI